VTDPVDRTALDAHEDAYLASLTAADADGDERAVEAALRPRTLDEVVGQQRVRDQLGLVLEAARREEITSDPDLQTLRNLNTREDYEHALTSAGFR
jgi:holliday junction DNA helicase RuvB